MSEFTTILNRVENGDAGAAHQLLPLVYDELRKLAAHMMAREAAGQTLQPTALVHEAWLRLVTEKDRTFRNRAHFFNTAAEAMRRILIDRARRRQCIRHGGGQLRVEMSEMEDLAIASPESDERLLQVHEALDRLAVEDSVKAEVVKLRFFIGMSDAEAAETLGLSERTVKRYWAYSKAWLFQCLADAEGKSQS
jgi:RNA polymerase sigma factor (TIGR02999 family)